MQEDDFEFEDLDLESLTLRFEGAPITEDTLDQACRGSLLRRENNKDRFQPIFFQKLAYLKFEGHACRDFRLGHIQEDELTVDHARKAIALGAMPEMAGLLWQLLAHYRAAGVTSEKYLRKKISERVGIKPPHFEEICLELERNGWLQGTEFFIPESVLPIIRKEPWSLQALELDLMLDGAVTAMESSRRIPLRNEPYRSKALA